MLIVCLFLFAAVLFLAIVIGVVIFVKKRSQRQQRHVELHDVSRRESESH